MKCRNGFTLIELLAVIIILGVLMLVAIPSVTNYINNSRKEAYIDTAREYIKGATNLVNSGSLDIFDTEVTYYIPSTCISLETGGDSPYGGDFSPAYVLVTYDNNTFNYYWISRDNQGIGMKSPISSNDLNTQKLESGIKSNDFQVNMGLEGRGRIIEFTSDCSSKKSEVEAEIIDGEYVHNEYTITLNANGGNVSSSSISITRGDAIGTLPTPTKTNYTFVGWFTDESNGTQVTSSFIPTSNLELFARYQLDTTTQLTYYIPNNSSGMVYLEIKYSSSVSNGSLVNPQAWSVFDDMNCSAFKNRFVNKYAYVCERRGTRIYCENYIIKIKSGNCKKAYYSGGTSDQVISSFRYTIVSEYSG